MSPIAPRTSSGSPSAWARLREGIATFSDVRFAVLVGSRGDGTAKAVSDWDIAVSWQPMPGLERIARHEILRRALAKAINQAESRIDLIDLADAGLAMRALVAEEGTLILALDEGAWLGFLTRTWRELETYYWEQAHAF